MTSNTKIINDSIYNVNYVTVKGNKWSILVVTGRFNYISIRKETNNPFKTLGRQFKDFNEAQGHYKCAEMKTALLMVEMDLVIQ
jgi:hypothetical protein